MVPDTYWSISNVDLANEMKTELLKNVPRDYKSRKSSYKNACKRIKQLVNGNIRLYYTIIYYKSEWIHHKFNFNNLFRSELEKYQSLFLRALLNDDDQTETKVSSRILFCRRFQSFVQENMIYWRVNIFKLFILYISTLESIIFVQFKS